MAEPGFTTCNFALRLVAPKAGQGADGAEAGVEMSSFVQDAHEQLRGLPFNEYRPIAIQEKQVPQGGEAVFIVNTNQFPEYEVRAFARSLEKNRVKLTLDWRETSGREIVSTQICVPNGENVVLGSDRMAGEPVMLLIKPNCR